MMQWNNLKKIKNKIMIKFIKSMLSGADGNMSSKRVVMMIFTLLFVGLTIANFVTGKNFDETLKQQLFYLLIWCLSMVFGEQIPEMISSWKGKKEEPPKTS